MSDDRTAPAAPVAGAAAPHDGVVERDPAAAAEWRASICFAASTVASVALAVVYWQGGQAQAEGILLAVITGGIGLGIVSWAKHHMPSEEVAEDRHPLASPAGGPLVELADSVAPVASAGTLRRRRVLLGLAGSSLAAMAGALVFPVRSLGPRPGKNLKSTGYGDSPPRRVVTADGQPVPAGQVPVDGVITVWPEGHVGDADSPTLLIHIRPTQSFKPRPGRADWTVEGVVAYSKLCTHVGCPVGLYQAEIGKLLCPCHQSTFDVLDGARPVFGPAAKALPQLPLAVDTDGFIIATGDFSAPTGPGFWDRDR
jgi:ubiquinol-cytochrome c reductase iron-sulfur subunit